jgi:hypothetical protein
MKLSKVLEDSYGFSAKSSDISRQLSFAGIAIIWIFRKALNGQPSIPNEFHLPLLCFVTALTLDILQYVIATIIWTIFHRYHEKNLMNPNDDPDVTAPPFANWLNWGLFFGKITLVFIAYANLISYLKNLWIN